MVKLTKPALIATLLPIMMAVLAGCDASQSTSTSSTTPSPSATLGVTQSQTPLPAAVSQAALANNAYKRGDYQTAVADFDKAIQLDPNYEAAYMGQGAAFTHLQELDKAVSDFTQAIKLDSTDDTAFYDRGLVDEEYEDPRNMEGYAIADYTHAIALKPDEPSYYDARGKAYAGQREYTLGIDDFNRAIALKPDFIDAYRDRALTYGYIFNYSEAIKDFTHVLDRDPSNASDYYQRALDYEGMQDYADERKDLQKALTLSTDPQLTQNVQQHLTTIQGR